MGNSIFWMIVLGLSVMAIKIFSEKSIRDKKRQKKEFDYYKQNGIKKVEGTKQENRNYYEFKKELKEKGNEYEKFVSGYFRGQGYTIAEHGIDNGKRDHGIDIIAKRDKEIIFIQCKNWKVSDQHKIDHRHIKEFIGNCTTYLEKNPMFGMCTIKRYFAVSDECMDYNAERFISENPQSIQKLLLPLPNA